MFFFSFRFTVAPNQIQVYARMSEYICEAIWYHGKISRTTTNRMTCYRSFQKSSSVQKFMRLQSCAKAAEYFCAFFSSNSFYFSAIPYVVYFVSLNFFRFEFFFYSTWISIAISTVVIKRNPFWQQQSNNKLRKMKFVVPLQCACSLQLFSYTNFIFEHYYVRMR